MEKSSTKYLGEVIVGKNKMLEPQERIIPNEVIFFEILPKLLVKSLLRFKCVSKKWASFISSPEFRQTHFRFQMTFPPDQSHFILLNSQSQCYSLCYDNKQCEFKGLDLLENNVSSVMGCEEIEIVGSYNGLVCLDSLVEMNEYEGGSSVFTLWNPATREFHKTAFPSPKFWSNASGFGYVNGLDDYKIFATSSALYDNAPYVGVFSLESDKWKGIRDSIGGFDVEVFTIVTDSRGVSFESGLYWCVEGTGQSEDIGIVEFDFVSEQLKLIPVWNSAKGFGSVGIHVSQERLLVCCHYWGDVTDVVLLKREGDGYSWEKLYSFPDDRVMGFTTINKRLVQDGRELKLVDPSDPEHCTEIVIEGYVKCVQPYVHTLISPIEISGNST